MTSELFAGISLSGRPALLSVADEPIAGSISQEDFDSSLLRHVLFGRGVVLHEAYFFNSSLLQQHIANATGDTSLFEAAARAGLIVPAFLDRDTEDLEDAYRRMQARYPAGNVPTRPNRNHTLIMNAIGAGGGLAPATSELFARFAAQGQSTRDAFTGSSAARRHRRVPPWIPGKPCPSGVTSWSRRKS
ncbi:MAG: hypothetical protein K0R38_5372 [Polyangiaceae bacterium]|jgi:hypothetical protein|nr:hypothetical protein [Polyangiaceae bacterium]